MTSAEARRIVKAAVKADVIPRPRPLPDHETDQLFRDRHAQYMREWREKWRRIIDERQLKLF
jgi:hypothetical protein